MATQGEEEKNCITILWKIENISRHDKAIHWCIDSPWINIFKDEDCYFSLRPTGESEGDKYISICLYFELNLGFLIDIEFSLLRCDGSPLVTRTLRNHEVEGLNFVFMPDPPTQEEVFVTRNSEFLSRDTLTVRCRIWKSNENLETSQFISAFSRIEVLKSCVRLPIKELRKGTKEGYVFKRGIESLKFSCSLEGDSLLNYVFKVLLIADSIKNTLIFNLKVSYLDDGDNLHMLCGKNHTFEESNKMQQWEVPDLNLWKLLSKNMPLSRSNKNFCLDLKFVTVGKIIFEFIDEKYFGKHGLEKTRSISVLSEASCQTDQNCSDTPDNNHQSGNSVNALVEDFKSLYSEQSFTDFKIRSGDVTFQVHKVVLSARSPVFKAMFSNNIKDSGTDSLDIPDLDSHTLNRMLTFLYTGTLEPDLEWESAAKVYYAADKYQVDTLKQECSTVLKSAISVSNVSNILTLADQHQDEDLKSFVHDFILSRFDEVIHSGEWEKLMENNPNLAGKSTLYLYKKREKRKRRSPNKSDQYRNKYSRNHCFNK